MGKIFIIFPLDSICTACYTNGRTRFYQKAKRLISIGHGEISWFCKIVFIITQQKPAFCEHVVFIIAKLTESSFGYTNHIKSLPWLKPLTVSHPNKIQSLHCLLTSPNSCLLSFSRFSFSLPSSHIGPLNSSQTH